MVSSMEATLGVRVWGFKGLGLRVQGLGSGVFHPQNQLEKN